MKLNKTISIIAIILLIAIISVASFFGIYKLEGYKVKNVVPKYSLGMEFNKTRQVELELDNKVESTTIYDKDGNEVTVEDENIDYTEENGYTVVENKTNPDNTLTKENYKKAKSILLKKLVKLGVEQYTVKQDLENGKMEITIPENDNTDDLIELLLQNGKFEVIGEDSEEVLLNNSHILKTYVQYFTQENNSVLVALRIELNKEGKRIFSEMSNKYIETTEQVLDEETGETKDETNTLNVNVQIDGTSYLTHYFQTNVEQGILEFLDAKTGIITIPFALESDTAKINKAAKDALNMKILLDSEKMPLVYTSVDREVSAENLDLKTCMYVTIVIVAIAIIYLIIKLRVRGVLAGLLNIGYIALLLLALRYTNIRITMEGICGIIVSIILNYIYTFKAFKNLNLNFITEITKEFTLNIIPVCIIAIVFTFNKIINISSLGMTLVWGIIIMYLYNLTLTQITAKLIKEDKNAKN